MATIIFVQADGTEKTVTAAEGHTLMTAAVENDVAGIEGECGGGMSCATCHVLVTEAWASRMPECDESESDVLELVDNRTAASRLGCQIDVTAALDGLRVIVPNP